MVDALPHLGSQGRAVLGSQVRDVPGTPGLSTHSAPWLCLTGSGREAHELRAEVWGAGRGHQARAPRVLPWVTHRTHSVPPTRAVTARVRRGLGADRDPAPSFSAGVGLVGPSARLGRDPRLRRAAGAQHEPCVCTDGSACESLGPAVPALSCTASVKLKLDLSPS